MSYTLLKRNAFTLDLKRLTSEHARILKGSLFHSRGQQWKTLAGHKFSCYNFVLQGVNDPLMTIMSLLDGKILKYLQDIGDRSHSMF